MSIATPTATSRASALERALAEVQASRPAATRVLHLVDDPDTEGRELAEAIEADPILTAQVLRLANSAAFGMSHRVASTPHAVSVVGFDAIRSVAALVASGLRNGRSAAPEGFWEHSAGVAAACSILSVRFGLTRGEAFSLGLLHDLGTAILMSVDRAPYAQLQRAEADTRAQCAVEVAEFGMSHAEAAAHVLSSWQFPEAFVDAIACHHDVDMGVTDHQRVLIAGELIAALAESPESISYCDPARLEALGLAPSTVPAMVALNIDYRGEIMASVAG
jgi:HD-like signal output (HDOD) protein